MNHSNRGILANCTPTEVFRFFEELCSIPHGSGNEAAIATYIADFAHQRGLFCHKDDANNVFIRLPASESCEDKPALMLQGHTDMVCEKDSDSTHDFLTDGLEP